MKYILKIYLTSISGKRHLEAASLLQNGQLIYVKDAGHLIRNDKPDVMETTVHTFLSDIIS